MKKYLTSVLSALQGRAGHFLSLLVVLYAPQVVYIAIYQQTRVHTLLGTCGRLVFAFLLAAAVAHLFSLITPPQGPRVRPLS